jgi:hypothetical protein
MHGSHGSLSGVTKPSSSITAFRAKNRALVARGEETTDADDRAWGQRQQRVLDEF